MPWWGWVLLWTMLVLALVAVLVVFAVRYLRAFAALGRELEHLMRQLEQFDPGPGEPESEPFVGAVLADIDDITERAMRSRLERMTRRQLRRDAAVHRGRLLARSPQHWT